MRQRLVDPSQQGFSSDDLGVTKLLAEELERFVQQPQLRHVVAPPGLTTVIEELANHIHVGLNVVLIVDKGLVAAIQRTLHISVFLPEPPN